jgi:hypothetical protein
LKSIATTIIRLSCLANNAKSPMHFWKGSHVLYGWLLVGYSLSCEGGICHQFWCSQEQPNWMSFDSAICEMVRSEPSTNVIACGPRWQQ